MLFQYWEKVGKTCDFHRERKKKYRNIVNWNKNRTKEPFVPYFSPFALQLAWTPLLYRIWSFWGITFDAHLHSGCFFVSLREVRDRLKVTWKKTFQGTSTYSASRTRTYDIMINSHALLPTELWRIKAKRLPYLTGGNPQLLPAF